MLTIGSAARLRHGPKVLRLTNTLSHIGWLKTMILGGAAGIEFVVNDCTKYYVNLRGHAIHVQRQCQVVFCAIVQVRGARFS